jgi:beta-N-acetylhexosaminidase
LTYSAFICGLAGPHLTDAERYFLRERRPCGVILFRRNCETPEQVASLTFSLRGVFGDADYLICIDQEGGRVQRLTEPHWPKRPPARAYCSACGGATGQALDAAYWGARLIAADLRNVGVNVNCAPVLDVPAPGAHDIIGDRAYGENADTVAAFGRAVAQAHLDGGVLPVIKHIPGHGRANADSHFNLPVITAPLSDLEADFAPFAALRDAPLAMTAHVLMTAIDADSPASASPRVIRNVIRERIGFDGLLMCDDVSMRALSGSIGDRTRAVLAAGCDVVLHCNGDMAEMTEVAENAPALQGDALSRFEAARARLNPPQDLDHAAAEARVAETLAGFT